MTNTSLFAIFRNMTILLASIMLVKYFIFLILAAYFPLREQIRRYRLTKKLYTQYTFLPDYQPKVSVIIPAHNEEVGIIKSIRSVIANHYPKTEIIIVNNGSTDSSREKVDNYISRHHHELPKGSSLKQYFMEESGKGRALNYGIRMSHGSIILTIDADSALAPDAIDKLIEYFRDPNIAAVVGQVRVANLNGRIISRMQQLEYLLSFYFKRAHCVLGAEYIYGGACAAFRRKATFTYFGLFNEKNKTEDIEMSMRTKFHGLRSLYAEDVLCYTEGAPTILGLMNQRLRWKRGRFDTFMAYRSLFFSLHKRHNKALAWFILPFALLAEFQLLLEPIGATFLITYSLVSGEYISLTLSMLFIGVTYFIVAIFTNGLTWRQRLLLIALWPITWPLFYLLVWIEFHALMRSIHMGLRDDAIEWQEWQREGIEV